MQQENPDTTILIRNLSSPEAEIWRAAVEALGRRRPPAIESIPALLCCPIRSNDPGDLDLILKAIVSMGPIALSVLRDSLRSNDPHVSKGRMCMALGLIGPAAAETVLDIEQVFRQGSEFDHYAAGNALARFGPAGINALLSCIRDNVNNAAEYLYISEAHGKKALFDLLRSPSATERMQAALVLLDQTLGRDIDPRWLDAAEQVLDSDIRIRAETIVSNLSQGSTSDRLRAADDAFALAGDLSEWSDAEGRWIQQVLDVLDRQAQSDPAFAASDSFLHARREILRWNQAHEPRGMA